MADESTIKNFAAKHRLRIVMDEVNDPVIKGRLGLSNIYEHNDKLLGVMFMTDAKKAPRTLLWRRLKAQCLEGGMVLRQEGDAEGSFTFDPENERQAKVAMRGIRVRVKRILTETQRAALCRNQFRTRSSGAQLSEKKHKQ